MSTNCTNKRNQGYVNVEQKGPFYGTLSLFMKVYVVSFDVSSIIPKLKSS